MQLQYSAQKCSEVFRNRLGTVGNMFMSSKVHRCKTVHSAFTAGHTEVTAAQCDSTVVQEQQVAVVRWLPPITTQYPIKRTRLVTALY